MILTPAVPRPHPALAGEPPWFRGRDADDIFRELLATARLGAPQSIAPDPAAPAPAAPAQPAPPLRHSPLASVPPVPDTIPSSDRADTSLMQAQWEERSGRTELRVRLDPPGLGPIDVHVRATPTGVMARLRLTNAATRDRLAAALPGLRARLHAAGIAVGAFDLDHDPPPRRPRPAAGQLDATA